MTAVIKLRSQFDEILIRNVIGWDEEDKYICITQKLGNSLYYLRYAKYDVLFWSIEVTKE